MKGIAPKACPANINIICTAEEVYAPQIIDACSFESPICAAISKTKPIYDRTTASAYAHARSNQLTDTGSPRAASLPWPTPAEDVVIASAGGQVIGDGAYGLEFLCNSSQADARDQERGITSAALSVFEVQLMQQATLEHLDAGIGAGCTKQQATPEANIPLLDASSENNAAATRSYLLTTILQHGGEMYTSLPCVAEPFSTIELTSKAPGRRKRARSSRKTTTRATPPKIERQKRRK
jgi:hypothetical protein